MLLASFAKISLEENAAAYEKLMLFGLLSFISCCLV